MAHQIFDAQASHGGERGDGYVATGQVYRSGPGRPPTGDHQRDGHVATGRVRRSVRAVTTLLAALLITGAAVMAPPAAAAYDIPVTYVRAAVPDGSPSSVSGTPVATADPQPPASADHLPATGVRVAVGTAVLTVVFLGVGGFLLWVDRRKEKSALP